MKIEVLRQLLVEAAQKFITEEEAIYFAERQIDCHIKKYPRVNPLTDAISDIEKWKENEGKCLEIIIEKGASLLLDFNGLAPSLKLKYIHDELESRSKKYGLSFVAMTNSAGIHTLNLWTDSLAERNLLAICSFNGGPCAVVPFNGTSGIFGTNPISYSIPTQDRPVIADFASSQIPFFEFREARDKGTELKVNTAVNKNGQPTIDAREAMVDDNVANLLPMGGGIKGYLISYLIEIMTGSLIDSRLSTDMTPTYVNEEHGGFILAFDIGSLTDIKSFKERVSNMNKIIRNQKPKEGVARVLVPGDNSYERAKNTIEKDEINIDKELEEKLKQLAK